MASVVVFCVTYALILPAVTQEHDVFCGLKEHVHSDSCYELQQTLVCDSEEMIPQSEAAEDPAAETDGEGTEAAPETTAEETEETSLPAGHIHEDSCLQENRVLTCTKEEHTHSLSCHSDPNADVEEESAWEQKAQSVGILGDSRQDALAFAGSQKGYPESSLNYLVDEDGETLHGYTRYGAWSGDPYGPWNGAFVRFCLHYMKIQTPLPQGNDPEDWIARLKKEGLFFPAGGEQPAGGELVFLAGNPGCVGFVEEYIPETQGKPAYIKVILGDQDDAVTVKNVAADSEEILGYSLLLDPAKELNACCERAFVGEDYTIYASYGRDAALPANVALTAQEILPGTEEYDSYYQRALTAAQTADSDIAGISFVRFFDVSFLSNGQEVEPAGPVQVRIVYAQPVELNDGMDTLTFHFAEGGPEVLDTAVSTTTAEDLAEIEAPVTTAEEAEGNEATEAVASFARQLPEEELPEGSINTFAFTTESFSVVAAATVTFTEKSGTFYQRIKDVSELKVGEKYLIVAAQGTYALRNNNNVANTANYQQVQITPVKGYADLDGQTGGSGHDGYYEVKLSDGSAVSKDILWTIRAPYSSNVSGVFRLNSVSDTATYLKLKDTTITGTSPNSTDYNILFTYDNYDSSSQGEEGTWTLRYVYIVDKKENHNYLYNSTVDATTGGKFTIMTNPTTGLNYSTSNEYDKILPINSTKFIILKEVVRDENDPFLVPDDVPGRVSQVTGANPSEPTYTNTDPGAVSGAVDQKLTAAGVPSSVQNKAGNIKWAYSSDPSTSAIEKLFTGTTKDDGKVLTDKSVIFNKDDYGAFNDYKDEEFGVTLSAIGQDYLLQKSDQIKIPIDVMLILDVSGSMTSGVSGKDENALKKARLGRLVSATNEAIKLIMSDNVENRVGVTLYSAGAETLLPLAHYELKSGTTYDQYNAYIKYYYKNGIADNSSHNGYCVGAGDNLQNKPADTGFEQNWGTYTQMGIQLGAEELMGVPVGVANNKGTQYTMTLHKGDPDYEKEVTVTRQPIMILFSDGEPTHASFNYADPKNGPHYGNGLSAANNDEANAKGIIGYYTILTANYFKRLVGIHYGVPAAFYSVGMGINETGDSVSGTSTAASDYYKRAVLNPSAANISAMTGAGANKPNKDVYTQTSQMLSQLLSESYKSKSVRVHNINANANLGYVQSYIPVLPNPYKGNYAYADDSFFGQFDGTTLSETFQNIIKSNINVKTHGFMLSKNNAKVSFADPIGEGMEVKGTPVLRYNAVNYTATSDTTVGNVRTLVYKYVAVTDDGSGGNGTQRRADLENVVVTITTDPTTGNQTVKMDVPESILPAFAAGPSGVTWYYKEYPIRLIYKVGLTAKSKQAVAALEDEDDSLTFYTNRWQNGSSADSVHDPHKDNPYYHNVTYEDTSQTSRVAQYRPYETAKSSNPTVTAAKSIKSTAPMVSGTNQQVQQEGYVTNSLGNNGKLTFQPSDTTELEVTKLWKDKDNNVLTDPKVASITLQLMRSTDKTTYTAVGNPVTVNAPSPASGTWKYTFEDLPVKDSQGNAYSYQVVETPIFGFDTTYGTATCVNLVWTQTITNRKLPTIDLPVQKKWTDENGNEIQAPSGVSSVTVHLYGDGKDTGKWLVLKGDTDANKNWKGTFEGIPEKASFATGAGKIKYTLVEDPVPGYRATVTEGSIEFVDLSVKSWVTVSPSNGFSAGETYRILLNGQVVYNNNSSVRFRTDTNSVTDTAEQWQISPTGTGSYIIKNIGNNRYFRTDGNNNFKFEISSTNIDWKITSDGKVYRSAAGWSRYLYKNGNGTTATISITTTSNDGAKFTFQKLVTGTSYLKTGLIVTNKRAKDLELNLEKLWNMAQDYTKPASVSLTVYLVKKDTATSTWQTTGKGAAVAWNSATPGVLSKVVLSPDSDPAKDWRATVHLDGVPNPKEYAIAVVEDPNQGFFPTYSNTGTIYIDGKETRAYVTSASDLVEGATLPVAVTNTYLCELPRTGGTGTTRYTLGGLSLIAIAAALYVYSVRRLNRREGSVNGTSRSCRTPAPDTQQERTNRYYDEKGY